MVLSGEENIKTEHAGGKHEKRLKEKNISNARI